MTLIIAEAGVNHNGREDLAFELIDAAHAAGADVVKFQTFKASKLVTAHAKQADYQASNTKRVESQLAMLSRLELSHGSHHKLQSYCQRLGIEFLSTAFDFTSLDFLVGELGLQRLKIPSGELTNAPLVLAHARSGCQLIVSTGMASIDEIESALGVIAFGLITDHTKLPSNQAFIEAYHCKEGQEALKKYVTLLHCTTEYPAPFDEINLRVTDTMAKTFGLEIGYSDHSAGISVPIAAVARGAVVIEKHFTLDKDMEGPDHKASLDPTELKHMVRSIRQIELALGSNEKTPTRSELKNKHIARKSLVAACDIAKGEEYNSDNIAIMRPGNGLSPYEYWQLLGKSALRDYLAGDLIVEE